MPDIRGGPEGAQTLEGDPGGLQRPSAPPEQAQGFSRWACPPAGWPSPVCFPDSAASGQL